jgi:ankyrin repeat protein
MVWGSISREVEAGTIETRPITDAGLDEGYPMYVLPVNTFLGMTAWQPHQDLLRDGKLKQFDESMRGRVLFCSHQWCSYVHPDPENDQLEALQNVITKLAAGELAPRGNGVVEHGFGLKIGRKPEEWMKFFEDAYLWFDFASMPQPLAAKGSKEDEYMAPHLGDHRLASDNKLGAGATTDASNTLELVEQLKRAVDSIPSYIERCAEMFILVPSVKHADRTGEVCDFNSWRSRGWCRMEFVSSRLCCSNDIPCLVISSREKTPEYFNLCDTMRLFAGHGCFTVDSDRSKVAGVLEKMIEAKAVSEYDKGNIGMFRAYLTLSGTFLMGLPKTMEMPEGVSETEAIKQLMKWRDDETEATWMKKTGCSPLHIACGLGRTEAVREMVKDPAMKPFFNRKMADINKFDADAKNKAATQSMGVQTIVGTCKDLTPLGCAMLCGDPEMVKLLINSGATPVSADFGIGCMMGPAANLEAFLDATPDFDINQSKKFAMMGNTPLHNVCMFGDSTHQLEKMKLLLDRGAKPSVHKRNFFGWTPLSGLAANEDSNIACVKLLTDAGANVDAQDTPGAIMRTMLGMISMMSKLKSYSNMNMMVDMIGYGRSPIHHAGHLANVPMIRELHKYGAKTAKLDKRANSAHDLLVKNMPDSHAPEVLSDIIPPLNKIKAAANAQMFANKLRMGAKNAQVLPNQSETPTRALPTMA